MKTTIIKLADNYPEEPPYHPHELYPEYNYKQISTKKNEVYESFRKILIENKYDEKNIGTASWNPLRNILKGKKRIVIKPNLVIEEKHELIGCNCITTHGSVIRALLDYIFLGKDKEAEVIICDVPLQQSNFDLIISQNGLKEVVNYYRNVLGYKELKLLDLRKEIVVLDKSGFIIERKQHYGDPLGYVAVKLNENSEFYELTKTKDYNFEVGDYERTNTKKHHSGKIHEYLISKTILSADIFFNVPKLKVHQKSGITVALKNIIGMNCDKSWLPHHRSWSPLFGGDEFPDSFISLINTFFRRKLQERHKYLFKLAKLIWTFIKVNLLNVEKGKTITESDSTNIILDGAWYGNDTIWRTVIDLNKIIFYADSEGRIKKKPQRSYYCLVDGIVASEGNGPLRPEPKKTGIMIWGNKPREIDWLSAYIMGFDPEKLKILRKPKNFDYTINDILSFDNVIGINIPNIKKLNLNFKPPKGWKNYIERK